jgi:hypothetical protein
MWDIGHDHIDACYPKKRRLGGDRMSKFQIVCYVAAALFLLMNLLISLGMFDRRQEDPRKILAEVLREAIRIPRP